LGVNCGRTCFPQGRTGRAPPLWKTGTSPITLPYMPQFTQHLPGTFSWPELATTDQKAAVAFYRALFGWDLNDVPMGPNETYSIFRLNGSDVGAAHTMRPEEREHGAPPHWNAYVTV